jgi:hypothetical protein
LKIVDCCSISPVIHAKMGIAAQKNTIGKILWQQVTTVVVLKQNIRQTAETPEDIKFRTALANMRFGACAQVDLNYLESRTISRRPGHPTFQDVNFRNVSLITALNAQKDKINEIGCRKFAEETKQELVDFYSQDTLVDNAGSRGRRAKTEKNREVVNTTKNLPMHRQRQLWDAFPSSSDHISGKLSLCLGLPALIRNNDATELCITKGQEATVVGWQEAVGNHGQRILDALFVELVKKRLVLFTGRHDSSSVQGTGIDLAKLCNDLLFISRKDLGLHCG